NRIVFSDAFPDQINLAFALPDILAPVQILGDTVPGYSGEPLVTINGHSGAISSVTDCFHVRDSARGTEIRALSIGGFSNHGIVLLGGADHCTIDGNWIGVQDLFGSPNGNGTGILVASDGNTIGGTSPFARNVISGNKLDGLVLAGGFNSVDGNFIGTNTR